MKYRVLKELYLTILTYNDSYMIKVPVGSELTLIKGDLCYGDHVSIDDHIGYLHYKFIEEWNANPTGDGSGLENLRASDPSL